MVGLTAQYKAVSNAVPTFTINKKAKKVFTFYSVSGGPAYIIFTNFDPKTGEIIPIADHYSYSTSDGITWTKRTDYYIASITNTTITWNASFSTGTIHCCVLCTIEQ